MNKVFLIIMVSFMISACGSMTTVREGDSNFRSGSQGLSITFVANNPPSTLYDTDPFNVLVEVQNRGSVTLSGAGNNRVYLSGFDNTIITGIGTDGATIEDLEARDQYIPEGEIEHLEFRGTVRNLGDRNIDKYPLTLLATACYSYSTVAQAMVCLDPDPYSRTSVNKICSGTSSPSMGTQGAPIAVSSVEVEPMPGRTKFKITISNVGGGTVFKSGYQYLSDCSPYGEGLSFEDIDFVTVTGVELSNVDITGTCKPLRDAELRLTNGRGQMICEVSDLSGPAITTPLTITLDYGYRSSITKNVQIISTPY